MSSSASFLAPSSSLLLRMGVQSCKKRSILKRKLAGCRTTFFSIASLFLPSQRAQDWAINRTQSNLQSCPDRFVKIAKKCAKLDGFYFLPRAWRVTLHANLAKEQSKKIWEAFSKAPHKAQRPSDGPKRVPICMTEGSLSRASCQENTLIFRGSLASQTSR